MVRKDLAIDFFEFAFSLYLLLLGGTFYLMFFEYKFYRILASGSALVIPGTIMFTIWLGSHEGALLGKKSIVWFLL